MGAKSARDDFRLFVEKADPWGGVSVGVRRDRHGDRIAFDRIDIDPVAEPSGNAPTVDTRTNNHKVVASPFAKLAFEPDLDRVGARLGRGDIAAKLQTPPVPDAGFGQAIGRAHV